MASKKDADTTKTVEFAKETAQVAVSAAKQGFDQTVAALKESMTGAVAGFEKTQTEMKNNMDKALKTAEEFASFGQGNIEAVMQSGQIWAVGMQDLSKSFAGLAQAQMEQTVTLWKSLAGVKSLKEAMDLQAGVARSSVETAISETGKLTDASMKIAEQTLAPITARVSLAVEKFGRAA